MIIVTERDVGITIEEIRRVDHIKEGCSTPYQEETRGVALKLVAVEVDVGVDTRKLYGHETKLDG